MELQLQQASLDTVPTLSAAIEILDAESTPEGVKHLRDQAEVIHQLFKRQRARSKSFLFAEIKLSAERKLGLMLSETTPRGRWLRDESTGALRGATRSLPEGITSIQSFRWRAIAAVPEDVFRDWVAAKKADDEELTQADLLRVAEKFIKSSQDKLDLNGGDDEIDQDGCGDEDGDEDEDEDEDSSGYTRQLILRTTVQEREELVARCRRLQDVYGTADITSTVVECVRRAVEDVT